jgi:hypothetical protein
MIFGAMLTTSQRHLWERLDQAADYVNDRLAANGEAWRLDSQTRAMLGLPLRANSVGAP